MENKQIITDYFEKDKDFPAKVVDIAPTDSYIGSCYVVTLKDNKGTYKNTVLVQNGGVIIAPR